MFFLERERDSGRGHRQKESGVFDILWLFINVQVRFESFDQMPLSKSYNYQLLFHGYFSLFVASEYDRYVENGH